MIYAPADSGRSFDTIPNQIARNGDGTKRIVLKIDVEGAERDSFARTPDDVLQRIDQLVVEFHWVHDAAFQRENGPRGRVSAQMIRMATNRNTSCGTVSRDTAHFPT